MLEILVYSGFMAFFFLFWFWVLHRDIDLYPDMDN